MTETPAVDHQAGDRVSVAVTEAIDHHGQTVVRGRYDGDFDRTNLPDEIILTNYFTVRDGKIVTLIIIHNTPPATDGSGGDLLEPLTGSEPETSDG
jgi:hypothetical protein